MLRFQSHQEDCKLQFFFCWLWLQCHFINLAVLLRSDCMYTAMAGLRPVWCANAVLKIHPSPWHLGFTQVLFTRFSVSVWSITSVAIITMRSIGTWNTREWRKEEIGGGKKEVISALWARGVCFPAALARTRGFFWSSFYQYPLVSWCVMSDKGILEGDSINYKLIQQHVKLWSPASIYLALFFYWSST